MKKFLSIFIAVAMVMSFAGMFTMAPANAPVAKAATVEVAYIYSPPSGYKVSPANAITQYYNPVPGFGSSGTLNDAYYSSTTDYYYSYIIGNTNGEDTYWESKYKQEYNKEYKFWRFSVIEGKVPESAIPTDAVYWTITALRRQNNGFLGTDYEATQCTVTSKIPVNRVFTLPTGNLPSDGRYALEFKFYDSGDNLLDTLTSSNDFIAKYDETTLNGDLTYDVTPNLCGGVATLPDSITINGSITRGFNAGLKVPLDVYIAYPDGTLAGYSHVSINSKQFSVTIPFDDTRIGRYYVYVRDGYGYDSSANDAIVYDYFDVYVNSSIPLNLSTYITPSLLYKNTDDQPFILVLKDKDSKKFITTKSYHEHVNPGDPNTGIIEVSAADLHITAKSNHGINIPVAYDEISPGIYRLTVDTTADPNAQDVRFNAKLTTYGSTELSNTVIVDLRDLGVFNPYVDIKADYAIPPYGDGPTSCDPDNDYDPHLVRDVYDKLPCTIGNAFEIDVWYYEPNDPANYYVDNFHATVNGPVKYIGKKYDNGTPYRRYLVEGYGQVSVDVTARVWQRANTDCPAFDSDGITVPEMAENACCHEYKKTFEICEVQSCPITSDSITIDGNSSIEVGKSGTLDINVANFSGDNEKYAADDIECGCNSKVVHIYMTNGCDILPDAFTVNVKNNLGGGTKTVDEIWFNPTGASGTNISDLSIKFGAHDSELDMVDRCTDLVINGFTVNYVNTEKCDYHLVIQVFGMKEINECGTIVTTYPLVYEGVDDISVTSVVKELSATYTITEGSIDPDEILAGTYPFIDITDPEFTLGDPEWDLTLNGDGVAGSVSRTDTGYRVTLACPLDDEGTFTIYGYALSDDCSEKEEVTINIDVVKPEFTVQIGLADGSTIDNDGIITEGIPEKIYVTPTDPRGIHDFSTDSNWTLKAGTMFSGYSSWYKYLGGEGFVDGVGNMNDCYIPTSVVYYKTPEGCTQPSPITVTGFANPNTDDDPTFNVYFVAHNCAYIKVGTFKLVPPTVKVDLQDVQGNELESAIVTAPATLTHVIFTVTDAHGHGAPDVPVHVSFGGISAAALGYTGLDIADIATKEDGEADWLYPFAKSGKYYVFAGITDNYDLPCGWTGVNTSVAFEAKYQAPVPDTEAPVLTVTAPEDGATVGEDTVTVEGTVTDNVGVTELYVGSQKVSFAPDGSFSATVELAEGENTIKVFAFDAAGNKAEKDLTVTYAVAKKTVVTVQIGSDVMTVNGQVEQLDVAPVIHEGHTYLPLRAIAEALGAKVDWIAATKGITLTLGDNTVGLQIGNVSAVVNGNVVAIFPPYLQPYGDGTYAATMVPLRVIAEGLGAEVNWDAATRVVTITLVQQP